MGKPATGATKRKLASSNVKRLRDAARRDRRMQESKLAKSSLVSLAEVKRRMNSALEGNESARVVSEIAQMRAALDELEVQYTRKLHHVLYKLRRESEMAPLAHVKTVPASTFSTVSHLAE